MEIKELQRNPDELRSVQMSIRTSRNKSRFMKEKGISPSKLFNKALEELMAGE